MIRCPVVASAPIAAFAVWESRKTSLSKRGPNLIAFAMFPPLLTLRSSSVAVLSMEQAKRDLVHAWLVKARNDLITAREISALPSGPLDTAIYHCQQAAEKVVKAFLTYHDHPLERTHDIERLVTIAQRYERRFQNVKKRRSCLLPTRLLSDIPPILQFWSPVARNSTKLSTTQTRSSILSAPFFRKIFCRD